MKDERYPIYELSRSKGVSVFEKELDIPQDQLTKYMDINDKFWAMQNLIEELYDETRSNS